MYEAYHCLILFAAGLVILLIILMSVPVTMFGVGKYTDNILIILIIYVQYMEERRKSH